MSGEASGLTFTADATQGAQHHLRAGLRIEGPFTSTRLVFRFPRWVPGSYFLREPIQHMFNFSAVDQEGRELTWKRVGVDGVSVALRKGSSEVSISYTLLAKELSQLTLSSSVRSSPTNNSLRRAIIWDSFS